MKTNQIVDLKNWEERKNLSVGFGTRDKNVLKQSKKGKVYFLVKTYDKDIGELRSEVCASTIGRLYKFPVQRAWLCRVPQHKPLGLSYPIGVLVQLDVRRQKDTRRNHFREDLVHAADLISFVDRAFAAEPDLKKKRRVYTLDGAIRGLRQYVKTHAGSEGVWDQFFELLTFDALIGNTDRHYYNWGVLQVADQGTFLRLAPAFDNGASLLWNMETYGPRFLEDPLTRNFTRHAESMFKKSGGGKYRLNDALVALHEKGEYRQSHIASDLLNRLCRVNKERIFSKLVEDVPQDSSFKTGEENLRVVAWYAMERLEDVKDTLARLATNEPGNQV